MMDKWDFYHFEDFCTMTQCDNRQYVQSTLSTITYMIRFRFANLYVLHEAVALPTARQGLPSCGDGREGDLHQLIHACIITQSEG